jgi:hypothetical protein
LQFHCHDVAASADGHLLVAGSENAYWLYEADQRLAYVDWLKDEFVQVVTFCKALIAPDGIPSGWVIDADVDRTLGWDRFHPASPDGAAWVVLMLLLNDRINSDLEAEPLVAAILQRYAGLAADGIRPERTVDGIYRHWYDPMTGRHKGEWSGEYAVLSTMKLVLAAERAAAYYPDHLDIQAAYKKIVCGVSSWGSYIQNGTDSLYLRSLYTGGPEPDSEVPPFFEGILFIEQAAAYGGKDAVYRRWLDRSLWEAANADCPACGTMTVNTPDVFQPAFVNLYPFLLSDDYRNDPEWQRQIISYLCQSAAWNDGNSPKYYTVFSAGTTDTSCHASGYHVDSLSSHPCIVAHFPALLGFSAMPQAHSKQHLAEAVSVAAYHAYRLGARQRFKGEPGLQADILYRRPLDESWTPNSAGLPDVVMGALALGELIEPGVIDEILAVKYAGSDDTACGSPADRVEAFITRFYRLCLKREPDLKGLNGWINALLDRTLTGADVARGFVFSPEFMSEGTTNEEYLSILYKAFFNREPDPVGWQGWLDALRKGANQEDVLSGFIFAKEFEELCDQYDIKAHSNHYRKSRREAVEAFVTRFYLLCLDRGPDPGGLSEWIKDLRDGTKTGADVAWGFVFSSEFINKNTSNSEYLQILYEAFFDRDPDPAGWDMWLGELDAGRDRGAVLDGFIYSTEFSNLCSEYGIQAF